MQLSDLNNQQKVTQRPENLVFTRKRPQMSRCSSVSIPKSFSNSSNLSVSSSQKSNTSPLLGTHNNNNIRTQMGGDKQSDARTQQQARIAAKHKKRQEINADAEIIRECAREAVDGSGVSWMKLRKIRKLMENESWRLYMLSRLNQSTQCEGNTEYVEGVEISPKAFRGIGDLFRAIESGIETNFKEKRGHGGLASIFFLLEIAHTHFCTKEEGGLSSGTTPRTSIKSIQDSLSSFDSFSNIKSAAGNAIAQINHQLIQQKSTDSKPRTPDSNTSRGDCIFLTQIISI